MRNSQTGASQVKLSQALDLAQGPGRAGDGSWVIKTLDVTSVIRRPGQTWKHLRSSPNTQYIKPKAFEHSVIVNGFSSNKNI